MKSFNILIVFLILVVQGYGQETENHREDNDASEGKMLAFGENFENKDALSKKEVSYTYKNLKPTDTLQTKFYGTVNEVCQAKGCWMKLDVADGEEVMVRFKDYSFFMPTDIVGKEVTVNGLAFISEMSVEDQRHYAQDAGKSEEEIANITQSKKINKFEASGVLLKE